jgi:putative FmdB family regulatory protein
MIYEYECKDCGNRFEEYCSTSENHEHTSCKKCGGTAHKIMSVPGGRYRFNDKK